jgi:hypothetical protein
MARPRRYRGASSECGARPALSFRSGAPLGFSIIRKANLGRQREILERNMVPMDALEGELDRIIELLERPPGR